MKTARYSDAQIMGILKQAEGCVPVSELCREHGVSIVLACRAFQISEACYRYGFHPG